MKTASNCYYQLIHESTIGEIHQCENCKNIKIDLGKIVTIISENSLLLLTNHLIHKRDQITKSGLDAEFKFYIHLNANNLFLALKLSEIDELIDLFSLANYMIKAQKILNPKS